MSPFCVYLLCYIQCLQCIVCVHSTHPPPYSMVQSLEYDPKAHNDHPRSSSSEWCDCADALGDESHGLHLDYVSILPTLYLVLPSVQSYTIHPADPPAPSVAFCTILFNPAYTSSPPAPSVACTYLPYYTIQSYTVTQKRMVRNEEGTTVTLTAPLYLPYYTILYNPIQLHYTEEYTVTRTAPRNLLPLRLIGGVCKTCH